MSTNMIVTLVVLAWYSIGYWGFIKFILMDNGEVDGEDVCLGFVAAAIGPLAWLMVLGQRLKHITVFRGR